MGALIAAASWFFLLHMLPSTPLRPRAVAIAGEGAYTAIFSIVSLISFYWLIHQFNVATYGDKLWLVPEWWRWVQAVLILFSFILLFGGLLTPNPSTPIGAEALDNPKVADGIFAITRHPVMWGAAIWGITHLISQATWRGFLFFGAIAATALIGSWLQQNSKARHGSRLGRLRSKDLVFPLCGNPAGPGSIQPEGYWLVEDCPRCDCLGNSSAFPLLAFRGAPPVAGGLG